MTAEQKIQAQLGQLLFANIMLSAELDTAHAQIAALTLKDSATQKAGNDAGTDAEPPKTLESVARRISRAVAPGGGANGSAAAG